MSRAAKLLLLLVGAASGAVLLLIAVRPERVSGEVEPIRLDFETGDLSQFDIVQRAAPDRLTVVRAPTRQGAYAARFEVRSGDLQQATTGIRAELIAELDDARKARAGDERWYT